MQVLLLKLLSNWRIWAAVGLLLTNVCSYLYGQHTGYANGAHAIQVQFDAFRQDELEKALAAQVAKNAIEEKLNNENAKVTENYESLQAATATAVRALDADRMRLLAALRAAHGDPAPANPGTGLPADATPEDRVLAECLFEYQSVVGDAEVLSNTVTSLQQTIRNIMAAWPK